MPLVADWKTAKTAFETATGKKKPSEKFLGIFRQGSGIESSLKEIDGAKDAAALRKSLAKFKTAYTDYVKLLEKNAADPKVVPAEDKSAYTAAIAKLKTELGKIEADGENIGQTLGDAGGKEKVDSNALKEADEHLKMREKGVVEAGDLVKQFKSQKTDIDRLIALATKQVAEAKKHGKSGNTMQHQVAVGVIDKCLAEIEAKSKQSAEQYQKKVTDSGSTLMKARADPTMVDKLPESVRKGYLPKSKDAFSKMAGLTAELTTLHRDIANKVDEIEALKAEAEGAGSTLKDPKAYVAQLQKVVAELKKERADIGIKGDRVIKGPEQIAKGVSAPKEAFVKLLKLQEDQWKRYEPDIKGSRARVANLLKQATAVPEGAREDAAIGKLVADAESAADEAVTYLDSVVEGGKALTTRIADERRRVGEA